MSFLTWRSSRRLQRIAPFLQRMVISLVLLGPVLFLASCACRLPLFIPADSRTVFVKPLDVYKKPLVLHFSRPALAVPKVLVVYATGDGGWVGLDAELFEWMSNWGYTVVGFSSRSYLKNLTRLHDSTTPRRMQEEYQRIIEFSETELNLDPDTRIILVGLSRGASFAVIAAGQPRLQDRLLGVLAIGLTKEEEFVKHQWWRRRVPRSDNTSQGLDVHPYEYLMRIPAVPVAVVQSTRDGYLKANAARELFGPDTDVRKLCPVEAKNHSFRGGCSDLFGRTRECLRWITEQESSETGP